MTSGTRKRTGNRSTWIACPLPDVICRQRRLDNLDGDLIVDAEQLMGDQSRVIYQFTLRAGAIEVLSGRATVVLDASVTDIRKDMQEGNTR